MFSFKHFFKNTVLLLVTLGLLVGCHSIPPEPPTTFPTHTAPRSFSYSSYETLLSKFVDASGRVDYEALAQNPQSLNNFYKLVATFSPDSAPRFFPTQSHQLAYWINAYNATVLKTVIEHYPIDSIDDVKRPSLLFFFPEKSGFFFFQRLTYGGVKTSLHYIENKVIRERFQDPRIHFALNCASIGCPMLPQTPFQPETLEQQLEFETRKFINDPQYVRIEPATNTIHISSIFQWYESDFTDWMQATHPDKPATLVEYIQLYLNEDNRIAVDAMSEAINIEYLPYDWGLNRKE